MPKAPVQTRTLLYHRLRDGTIRILDWHLVNTTLGGMIEPRTLNRASGAMVNEDPYDSGYTDMLEVSTNVGVWQFNLNSAQWPRVFNTL